MKQKAIKTKKPVEVKQPESKQKFVVLKPNPYILMMALANVRPAPLQNNDWNMKRFLLFAFEVYYPSGGWFDFQGSFDTQQKAVNKVIEMRNDLENPWDIYQIVDAQTEQIVAEGEVKPD